MENKNISLYACILALLILFGGYIYFFNDFSTKETIVNDFMNAYVEGNMEEMMSCMPEIYYENDTNLISKVEGENLQGTLSHWYQNEVFAYIFHVGQDYTLQYEISKFTDPAQSYLESTYDYIQSCQCNVDDYTDFQLVTVNVHCSEPDDNATESTAVKKSEEILILYIGKEKGNWKIFRC